MSSAASIARSSYHHGNLRRALLDKAYELYAEHGDLRFSFRELARHAGVTHTAPYRHFANKAELLEALVVDALERLATAERDAVEAAGADHRERIRGIGVAYIRFALNYPSPFRLALAGPMSSVDAENTRASASYRVLERAMRDGQNAGVIRTDMKSRDLAFAAWSAVHGTACLLAVGRLPATEEAVRRYEWVLSTMFLDGADVRASAKK
ncbi:MAG: TetR/AcrR family transcriptional regulator [Polyangiaceae bacterium]